ncbi:cyclase family protein [Microbacterium rhizomatis]|uniref:Cyclase family protein n=1 Tax=Microbacterium rhizomatis TaxID=1631477 RepID=A0A5J5J0L6_9MICO|nr:cyclase family protein [Microbacterium rhizomatis]KAA9105909.1 cyclase family protein [Microbacterium rhizomatis]
MATLEDFHTLAQEVRNWGRWGDDDELGTLNFITPEIVRDAAKLVRTGKQFALGIDFSSGGPQGAFEFRTNPIHTMTVDGGDAETLLQYTQDWPRNTMATQLAELFPGPFRFNDDMIVMPLQAATQWDALSHVYYDEKLYNGFPADSVTSRGAFYCGIDKVDVKGITSRGILLDAVAHRRKERFVPLGDPILPHELDEMADAQGVEVRSGDIILLNTGWAGEYKRTRDRSFFTAGLDWTCARWLHEHEIAAIAADHLQVEDIQVAVEGTICPMHMLCLRDMGLMLGEYWDLEALSADCADDGVYEFMLVAPPLRVTGAVGSPINPIAIK